MTKEVEVGGFKFFVPSYWEIKVEEVGDGKYRLKYVEKVRKPKDMDLETFKAIAKKSAKIAEMLMFMRTEVTVDGDLAVIKFTLESDLDVISSMIVSEFIFVSRLGDTKLREMLYYPLREILQKRLVYIFKPK